LSGHGVQLAPTREELRRSPHDDSVIEKFVRESSAFPEGVTELRDRLKSIFSRSREAVANQDFETARSCSDEERIVREKLRSVYEEKGLSGWIFE
jgi:hypothetical protein